VNGELQQLLAAGALRDIDCHFAGFVGAMAGPGDHRNLLLLAALACNAPSLGDVCVDLQAIAGEAWPPPADDAREGGARYEAQVTLPSLEVLLETLRSGEAGKCVTETGDPARPLVLTGNRYLYMYRFWKEETCSASALVAMAAAGATAAVSETLIKKYLDAPAGQGGDAQRAAAKAALENRIAIVSGGPGTGKTYTVARIIKLLMETDPRGRDLRIKLAAPTGKAAARLNESIRNAGDLDLGGFEASTIHRLLGGLPGIPSCRHNKANPVDADVVIIDESSMMDLTMVTRLLDALAKDTRLILLGDRYQLPSVSLGKVFSDICESDRLSGRCVQLTHSRRFLPSGKIAQLGDVVNSGDADAAIGMLKECREPPVVWLDRGGALETCGNIPVDDFRQAVFEGYLDFLNAVEYGDVFRALGGFRVLCAVNSGPRGVTEVNRLVEEVLSLRNARPGSVPAGLAKGRALRPAAGHYDHRVIMITSNDHAMGLYNGDIGVILPSEKEVDRLVAVFEQEDGGAPGQGATGYREVPVGMLPEHKTAFAMTIHKSQGSEFERLVIILPDRDSPVLTRELLYTAITRVKQAERIDLWGPEAVIRAGVVRSTHRLSRLKDIISCAQGGTGLSSC